MRNLKRQTDIAADRLLTACYAAHAAPEGIYHGTACGPASLRIHELAVAAERRSHYYIDLAA